MRLSGERGTVMNWTVRADFSYMLEEDDDYVRGLKDRIEGYKKDLEEAQRRFDNAETIEDEQRAWEDIDDLTYGIETLEQELEWFE